MPAHPRHESHSLVCSAHNQRHVWYILHNPQVSQLVMPWSQLRHEYNTTTRVYKFATICMLIPFTGTYVSHRELTDIINDSYL